MHTGAGRDTATDRYWGSKRFVWGNSHDTARLRTPDGATATVCRWTTAGAGSITC